MPGDTAPSEISTFKTDLRESEPSDFAMRRIFDAVPALFSRSEDWTAWKLRLARALKVDAHSVVVIGSSCLGFSLNPAKNFRAFGVHSDVDVAIVSGYHFELAWRFLRDVGASVYSLPRDVQTAIANHRAEYVFWGTIACEKLLPYILPFGPDWVRALAAIERDMPVNGKPFKVRLYRDSYSLVGYHVNGIRKLRQTLISD